jgi:hypothetical protein
VGDCCSFEGHVGDRLVQIRNVYRDRSTLRPEAAVHVDIYAKMVSVLKRIRAAKDLPYLRLEGCPGSVAELILVMAELGNTKNPYLDPREILRFNAAYLGWRATQAAAWVDGEPYLAPEPGLRGDAAPCWGQVPASSRQAPSTSLLDVAAAPPVLRMAATKM